MAQAVSDLKREFRGHVFGRLPDVCSVKGRKYNNAIAVLSGRHMDSVVVSTLDVAKDCMSFLKDKQLEPMEFIPLDNIIVRAFSCTAAPRVSTLLLELLCSPLCRTCLRQFSTWNTTCADAPDQ